jgi:anti-anti-sigma regulatory factor
VEISLEQGEAASTVRLDGDITIELAADLKLLLLEALSTHKPLRLDFTAATQLDVTAMQLLWAAHAAAAQARLTFTALQTAHISNVFGEAGFTPFLAEVA